MTTHEDGLYCEPWESATWYAWRQVITDLKVFHDKWTKIAFQNPSQDYGLITILECPEKPLVTPPKQRACVPYSAEELRALRKTVHAPCPYTTFQVAPLLAWNGKS